MSNFLQNLPRRRAPHHRVYLPLALLISSGVTSATEARAPASYLAFNSELDGRCYNLSAGGKLVTMVNSHPRDSIKFRLTRYFAGVPQGLSVGAIAPNGSAIKLGCDQVDGRPQSWKIERATLIKDPSQ